MSRPAPSSRRWFLYSAVTLIFAAAVWYFGFRSEPPKPSSSGFGGFRSRGNTQPVPVRAVAAQLHDLTVNLRAIGTAVPLNTVTVRSRVEGPLLRVMFQEGQFVEKGQVLAAIDPVQYQIRLAQAEARLRQNEAQLMTARNDAERFKQLHAQNLVTQQQLEAQQALVAEREGAHSADKAAVDDARRQLEYTTIEAPISGRLGLRQVDVGNLIRPGDAGGLVVITQTRPIAVIFTVPEIDLQKVIEPLRRGEELPVEAWDRGEEKLLASGVLKTTDNQIDLATGTLRLKAEFPNTDERLFPNQFVNIRLRVRTLKDAVVIPTAAVQFGSRGTYVFAVNEQNQATVRDVVLGPTDGDRRAVLKGLQAGDRVVLEGIDRLREGRSVMLVGDDAPTEKKSGDAAPKKGTGDDAAKKRKKESAK